MRSDPRGDVAGSPRRLWVELEPFRPPRIADGQVYVVLLGSNPPPLKLGVTGLDAEDCWKLVTESWPGHELPQIRTVVWDVDVSSLDVLPARIGNPAARGVWYPNARP